jgi:hypothetical protein
MVKYNLRQEFLGVSCNIKILLKLKTMPFDTELELHPIPQDIIAGIGIDAIRQMEAFLRDVYRKSSIILEAEAQAMLSKGGGYEDIARWVVNARNQAKIEIRALDFIIVKRYAELRNKIKYRGATNPSLGPDYEYYHNVKGKSDIQIIEGGARTHANTNQILGKNMISTEGMQTSGGNISLTQSQKVWVGRLKICGRIMISIDIGIGYARYKRAPTIEKPHVLLEEGGGILGAVLFGWATGALGAEACGAGGAAIGATFFGIGAIPGAIIGVGACSAVGAVTGGWLGRGAGKWVANELYPISQTYVVEE